MPALSHGLLYNDFLTQGILPVLKHPWLWFLPVDFPYPSDLLRQHPWFRYLPGVVSTLSPDLFAPLVCLGGRDDVKQKFDGLDCNKFEYVISLLLERDRFTQRYPAPHNTIISASVLSIRSQRGVFFLTTLGVIYPPEPD